MFFPKRYFYVPIQLVKVDISEQLTGQITERNALALGDRETTYDIFKQLKGLDIDNAFFQKGKERGVIDRSEKPPDVAFQSVDGSCIVAARLVQESPQPLDGGMRAFSYAARITVMDKSAFEKRLDDVHDSLMHDPILHRSLMNPTLFRIENGKRLIGIVPVFAGEKAVA